MSFKKVYDADRTSSTWDHFDHMDHPRETFKLVEEVTSSQIYNGLIEFRTATEAKTRLKQQLAHFMGDRLSGAVRPIKTDVHEILAEVKSLRNLMAHSGELGSKSSIKAGDPFYIALRFLLAERNKDYTKFVESVFGDLDVAAHEIKKASNIEEVVKKAGGTLEVLPDSFDFRALLMGNQEKHRLQNAVQSIAGTWALTTDKHVYLSESMRSRLNDQQAALSAKLK